ncbi:hypothetical protein LCGC14_0400630 [marine sediment metagenome]|uniref:Uncharacterized protein n=1 Tax=marine sediment metagenome TaxID=412755 RepID=A0A0F9W634_9ZZZZ
MGDHLPYDELFRMRLDLMRERNQLQARIKELEEVYFGQIRVIARSRITYKKKVERMVRLAEHALNPTDKEG